MLRRGLCSNSSLLELFKSLWLPVTCAGGWACPVTWWLSWIRSIMMGVVTGSYLHFYYINFPFPSLSLPSALSLLFLFSYRYVDYPVADILQMIGLANRPLIDDECK